MDALISLPLISYLLIPGTTSWSTSLNLLFFTVTWTTLTLSHPPLKLELVAVLAIRLVFWLLPSLVSLVIDLAVPSLAGQFKHRGSAALPPTDAKKLTRALGLAVLNLFLSITAEGGISYALSLAIGRPVFRDAAAPPLPWNLAKHLVLLFVGREVLMYYIHLHVLHTKSSNPIAKKLTHYHTSGLPHARKAPMYSLLLFADHPGASLFLRFVPLYVPALVLRPHLLSYLAFVLLVTVEETASHSGYSVVPGILLGGVARRCAVHYAGGGGRGNFGAWGVMDWAHGTSMGGQDVVGDLKDEAEKHDLPERGQKVAGEAVDRTQDGLEGWSGRLRGRDRKG